HWMGVGCSQDRHWWCAPLDARRCSWSLCCTGDAACDGEELVDNRIEDDAQGVQTEATDGGFGRQKGFEQRPFGVSEIVDAMSRGRPAIEGDTSLPGTRVVAVLEQVARTHGLLQVLQVGNGPEFLTRALDDWVHRHGVTLAFSRPGTPTDNPYIEAFNGRLRTECWSSTGSSRWRRRGRRLRPGGSITTRCGHTPLCVTGLLQPTKRRGCKTNQEKKQANLSGGRFWGHLTSCVVSRAAWSRMRGAGQVRYE